MEIAIRIGGKTGLNCIARLIETTDIEQIVAESSVDGPLAGIPVLVKDNIEQLFMDSVSFFLRFCE